MMKKCFVLVSGYVSCARLSCILSFRVHVKLLYRIVSQNVPVKKMSKSVNIW